VRPTINIENALYADEPAARLAASARLKPRDRRKLLARPNGDWPADSPGAVNAWLLLVTTKPPTWRDPYVMWRDAPPTLGEPHEGFFYPDPLGFWAEIRHWAEATTGLVNPDALSVSAVLHGSGSIDWALALMRPRVVLFLDEPAWQASGIALATERDARHIPDPYRAGQLYEGWWAEATDGRVIGKAPQHPAAHKLYRRQDMDGFLSRSAPAAHTRSG
jgi:hypothetical protein